MLQTLTKIDYAIDHCTGNAKCYTCSKFYTYMSLLFFEQNKTNRSVSFMYASVLICFFLYTHTHTHTVLSPIDLSFFFPFISHSNFSFYVFHFNSAFNLYHLQTFISIHMLVAMRSTNFKSIFNNTEGKQTSC